MKEVVVDSLGESVGTLWKNLQKEYTTASLFFVSSPLSSTPISVYNWITNNSSSFEGWEKTRFVLMDELVEGDKTPFSYISIENPASYERFAKEKFIDPLREKIVVDIPIIKPDLSTLDTFQTPINLLILAIGVSGNYANVMPGTPLETGWHVARLSSEFQASHTQKGKSYEGTRFSDYGMSLGPQQVLGADNVIVIISGSHKKELRKQLLSFKDFDKEFPLSIIYHPKISDGVQIFTTRDVLL